MSAGGVRAFITFFSSKYLCTTDFGAYYDNTI